MAEPEEPAADLPRCPAESGSGTLRTELRAWMLLLAATGAIEQRLRAVVKARLNVSHDEFLVLCLLADQADEALRMTRIAELLGRPKTRLTYQIACLQHAGLVSRRSVCGDRRGVEVALTEKGRRLLAEASPDLVDTVRHGLAEAIGPAQCEALRALLPDLDRPADDGADEPRPAAP
ncbi:MarR family transcriptional regulator [Streptomyces sp. 8K308]|uniref:MarR family winged helix-turn-helix transcriptional regulator n=1 Tax=Streptomyces sp. 8K308 TaxID=2530388 RepID=UPI0010515231|nr:MarR family transcriptional regulator [Streptomyces sp. 8K308]TDC21000.1 MarR family transcriptional regulator [Streptomyces sp. 8K308]